MTQHLRQCRILVIDPSTPTRLWMKRQLSPDYSCDAVASCSEARAALQSGGPVHLIIMEYLLPEFTGLEFAQHLQADGTLENTALILCTGVEEEGLMAKAFELGISDFFRKPLMLEEVRARVQRCLQENANKQRYLRSLSQLQVKSERDPLTGVYNRAAMAEYARKELAKWRRNDYPLSLLLIDIDNFKAYNDRLGHLAGDKVLQHFADVLMRNTRSYDLIGRFGGDEFVAILPHVSDSQALMVAEKIRLSLEKSDLVHNGKALRVTPSIGIASFNRSADQSKSLDEEFQEMLERADRALYRAKREGRNRLAVAT